MAGAADGVPVGVLGLTVPNGPGLSGPHLTLPPPRRYEVGAAHGNL